VSTFGSSGGLGEAAAWLCLRQEIYVSLTTQQPLRTNLENFYDSNIFQRDDDFAWSSRIVFLLAKVLQSAFSDSSMVDTINDEVEAWFKSKPLTFEPVRLVPRGPESDRRFPAIWMLLPVHGRRTKANMSSEWLLTLPSHWSTILSHCQDYTNTFRMSALIVHIRQFATFPHYRSQTSP
jgi:hypothetical protein